MSTLKADTIQSTSGGAATLTKQHASKMWANVAAGAGSYRDSFNSSTLTDHATGRYGVSLTNSMSDANYCGVPGGHTTNANDFSTQHIYLTEPATSTLRIKCNDSGGSAADWTLTTALVQGDLA